MVAPRKVAKPSQTRRPPATTPEAREQQLIGLAVDLVEQQLLNGTASSQVITHYLKLGSTREKLEQTKLQRENILLEAKAQAIESAEATKELYEDALKAMRSYSGQEEPEEEDYDV